VGVACLDAAFRERGGEHPAEEIARKTGQQARRRADPPERDGAVEERAADIGREGRFA